ncbi:MAG: iron-sulfur cluster carrier protein MrpORP [Planctomycetota bacterium]
MPEDKSCDTCDAQGGPSSPAAQEEALEQQALAERLGLIDHKILVLSGKGGVGKSTVAANLAVALAQDGRRTGLLDIDLHGPSIPKLLHLDGQPLASDGKTIEPVVFDDHLKVLSIGFLLQGPDDAVIWRGPLKMGVIKQFIKDVNWGELDYLVVDSPPGTGDEPLSIAQLIPDADGAVIVTTPQDVAIADVRKCVNFCAKLDLAVLGVVENMSGFVCPHCGERTDLFGTGGGETMAQQMGVPFLGPVPLDPGVVASGDAGQPFVTSAPESPTAQAFQAIVSRLTGGTAPDPQPPSEETPTMKIALPTAQGKLCLHFGHCQQFAIVTVSNGAIQGTEMLDPPAHEPGALPRWLDEQGVDVIIAGGMGRRAQSFFNQFGIEVVIGAQPDEPQKIVRAYLDGALRTGQNICDH